MLLYLEDWKKYENAIVDYDTRNKSWLRQAQVYHSMGIENCLFPLALIQPELQGVDPYDQHLDMETKVRIGLECRENPWYYFREVVRVPAQGGLESKWMNANRGNIAMWWIFLNDIDSSLIQPRQTGKSLSADELMIFLTYVASRNSRINMVTKDDSLRKANVDRLKDIRNLLPPYLIPMSKDDSDNMFELSCRVHNNRYVTAVAQNSESAANNLGRGLTSPVMQFDEGPFISFIDVTVPAALAATTAAKAEAAAYGQPHANLFTTTAGKLDDRSGAYMYEMISEAAKWNETFFDAKNKADLLDMIIRNKTGRKIMVNITMSHRQLGYTDEWLYATMAENKAKGDAADRDYFNRWTSGSRRSPLSIALNELIRHSHQDVSWMEMSPEHYGINWYLDRDEMAIMEEEVDYIIGLDTSDAVGRDAIAMVITNAYDLSVAGVGSFNETNLLRFGEFLASFMIKHPKTTLVIERRSSGMAIIDTLIIHLVRAGIDPFKRIYNKIVDQASEKPNPYRDLITPVQYRSQGFYDQRKTAFGLATDAQSRDLLYTIVLQNAAKKGGTAVHDLTLINEITGLVEKNGRIDHANSKHDDHVIAWLLTHWFLFHTRNLAHYGIDVTKIAVGISDDGLQMSDDEIQAKVYQDNLMGQIDALAYELRTTKDPYMVAQLESKLKSIDSRLVAMNITAPTVDALLTKVKEERDKRSNSPGNPNGFKPLARAVDVGRIMRNAA